MSLLEMGKHAQLGIFQALILGLGTVLTGWIVYTFMGASKSRRKLKLPPLVPGVPIFGNMMQLKVRKPGETMKVMGEKYGDLFCIKAGQLNTVVICSGTLAKELLINNHDSTIHAFRTHNKYLARDGNMVALGDQLPGDNTYSKMKRAMVSRYMDGKVQKGYRQLRDDVMEKTVSNIYAELKSKTSGSNNVIDMADHMLESVYSLYMTEVCGYAPQNLYVEGMGNLTKKQIIDTTMTDCMKGFTMIDWRNYFPSFNWVPNKKVELELGKIADRKEAVIRTLLDNHRKALKAGNAPECVLNYLLTEGSEYLNDVQIQQAVWEPINATLDSSTVTAEWVVEELANHPEVQERVYEELRATVGDRPVNEEDLPNLPLLNAVFHETTRLYPGFPIFPTRETVRDVTIGGFLIPKGYNVTINNYAISRNKNDWKDADAWIPDRILEMGGSLGDNALPFGAGKRKCVGYHATLKFVPLLVGNLVQHFQWALSAVDSSGCKYEAHEDGKYSMISPPRFKSISPRQPLHKLQ